LVTATAKANMCDISVDYDTSLSLDGHYQWLPLSMVMELKIISSVGLILS
jgi:hypothetical protein